MSRPESDRDDTYTVCWNVPQHLPSLHQVMFSCSTRISNYIVTLDCMPHPWWSSTTDTSQVRLGTDSGQYVVILQGPSLVNSGTVVHTIYWHCRGEKWHQQCLGHHDTTYIISCDNWYRQWLGHHDTAYIISCDNLYWQCLGHHDTAYIISCDNWYQQWLGHHDTTYIISCDNWYWQCLGHRDTTYIIYVTTGTSNA